MRKMHGPFSEPEQWELTIDHDGIKYCCDRHVHWSCALTDLAIIGECTNENGPCFDDHFIVFVLWDAQFETVPVAVDGSLEILDVLESRLHAKLELKLFGSTSLASRIMWPQMFAERPLFAYQEAARSVWERLFAWLLPRWCISILVPEIEVYLTEEAERRGFGATADPGQ